MAEPEEQSFEIVFAGLLDLGALDENVVEDQFFVCDQLFQIEAKGRDVCSQFLVCLFERHEHAGFVEEHRATHEKFHGKQGLAGAGAAANERGSARGQTSSGDFVKTGDSCAFFLETFQGFMTITTVLSAHSGPPRAH